MKIQKLKNGIPVILAPMLGAKSVTVQLLFRVGSRYETKENNGASHFVEHLMFKGTKRRPESSVLLKEIDQLGAIYNASTDKHITEYHMRLDASKTEQAIDILSDMTMCSTFAGVDSERGVIVEEINMYKDNPSYVAWDLLDEIQYKDSPLGKTITGPADLIKTIPKERLIDHYRAYYHPKNMVISLAGKIVPGVIKMLEKAFSVPRTFEPTANGKPFIQFTPSTPKSLAFEKKETEQTQLLFGFYGPKMYHKQNEAAKLLAKILGGGMSSRLFLQIREKMGLCYSVYAHNGSHEDVGSFVIGSGLDKKRFPEATKAIISMLKDVAKNGVTKEELQRAKDNIQGTYMLSFEDSQTQAGWYGNQLLLKGSVTETIEQHLTKIHKTSVKEVNDIAAQILQPKFLATAVVGPLGKAAIEKNLVWS